MRGMEKKLHECATQALMRASTETIAASVKIDAASTQLLIAECAEWAENAMQSAREKVRKGNRSMFTVDTRDFTNDPTWALENSAGDAAIKHVANEGVRVFKRAVSGQAWALAGQIAQSASTEIRNAASAWAQVRMGEDGAMQAARRLCELLHEDRTNGESHWPIALGALQQMTQINARTWSGLLRETPWLARGSVQTLGPKGIQEPAERRMWMLARNRARSRDLGARASPVAVKNVLEEWPLGAMDPPLASVWVFATLGLKIETTAGWGAALAREGRATSGQSLVGTRREVEDKNLGWAWTARRDEAMTRSAIEQMSTKLAVKWLRMAKAQKGPRPNTPKVANVTRAQVWLKRLEELWQGEGELDQARHGLTLVDRPEKMRIHMYPMWYCPIDSATRLLWGCALKRERKEWNDVLSKTRTQPHDVMESMVAVIGDSTYPLDPRRSVGIWETVGRTRRHGSVALAAIQRLVDCATAWE